MAEDSPVTPTEPTPLFEQYPEVPFDIDGDVRRCVLKSCVARIEGNYYTGRAHGTDLVIDKDTAYFNASNLLTDREALEELLDNDETIKLQLAYIADELKQKPFYRVSGEKNALLNGIYMHGLAIGNILSHALVKRCDMVKSARDA